MNNFNKILALIAVVVMILVFAFIYYDSTSLPRQTINVNGNAEVQVIPDEVSIYFNIETNGTTAKIAKDKNANVVDIVMFNLRGSGFTDDDISTENFNVYEDYKWVTDSPEISYRPTEQKLIGYKASHTLRVKVAANNTEMIGRAIDAGVDNGAKLNYINFELSNEKQNEFKAKATKLAAENAKIQAQAMADGVGMKLGKVVSVSDTNYNGGYQPYRAFDGAMYAQDSMAKEDAIASVQKITTDVNPGERSIYANVNVVYALR